MLLIHEKGVRPGWFTLCADVCWERHGGAWARRDARGAFWIVRFSDLEGEIGERDFKGSGLPKFEADVSYVDVAAMSDETVSSALQSCGLRRTADGIVSDQGDLVADAADEERMAWVLAEALHSSGSYAPMHSVGGKSHPMRVRAAAMRFAEEAMRDAAATEALLERPVNAIGSTAREYAAGDIESALFRGPHTPEKDLMIKLGVR